ncbi:MAG: ABC transporter permease subunit [Alphaproteobacteria bacterium]
MLKRNWFFLSDRHADNFAAVVVRVVAGFVVLALCFMLVFLAHVAWPLLDKPAFTAAIKGVVETSLNQGGAEEQAVSAIISDKSSRLLLGINHAQQPLLWARQQTERGSLLKKLPLPDDLPLNAGKYIADFQHEQLFQLLPDGKIRVGALSFTERTIPSLPQSSVLQGDLAIEDNTHVFVRSIQEEWHEISLKIHWGEALTLPFNPIQIFSASAANAEGNNNGAQHFLLQAADGQLMLAKALKKKASLMDGGEEKAVAFKFIPLPNLEANLHERKIWPYIKADASRIILLSADGTLDIYGLKGTEITNSKSTKIELEAGEQLTAAAWHDGGYSFFMGTSHGRGLLAQLHQQGLNAEQDDKKHPLFYVKQQLLLGQGAVASVLASQASRTVLFSGAAGWQKLIHATSGDVLLAQTTVPANKMAIALLPDDQGWVSMAADHFTVQFFDLHDVATSLRLFFAPIWYEGHEKPSYLWQSTTSSARDEAKLSLVPLIFGTAKASFYALLIALPLGMAAALASAEFLSPRSRSYIKPVVEMMASIPSVVLGFVAAFVLIPILPQLLGSLMLAVWLLPVGFSFVGRLLAVWSRKRELPNGYVVLLLTLLMVAICLLCGSWAERVIFYGSMNNWLAGEQPILRFWLWLLFPLCWLLQSLFMPRLAGYELLKPLAAWLAVLLPSIIMALALALLLQKLAVDPRGGILGAYTQRNALLAGFAVGFACIPVIYTLMEDALTNLPDGLRQASMACGASPWQTATRICLPAARSGVLAAVMLATGRALGETMIVLMTTGNTPILDSNMFNGLRSLSATIAIEIPEAARDSTHYRVLFLCALLLLLFNMVLNMLAEAYREYHRRRWL